jgi:hypothetical protein
MPKNVQTLSEDDAKMLAKKYNQEIVCIVACDSRPILGAIAQVITFGVTSVLHETAKQMGISIKSNFGWRNPKSAIRRARKVNKQLRQRGGIICCDCWCTQFTVSTHGDECYVTCGKCGKAYSVFSKKEI